MTARILTPLAVLGLVVLLVVSKLSGDDGHHVSIIVPSATSVIEGQEVRAAGQAVGKVHKLTPVDGGRKARVDFRIDDVAWPLTRGSTLELRWGGTIAFNNRYFALERPTSGAPIAEGTTLPPSAAKVPVEFAQLLHTFTPATRRDLRTFIRRAGVAVGRSGPPLRRALDTAPPGAVAGQQIIRDLISDKRSLTTLVRSTDSVVHAVRTANPALRELLEGAATTFAAVAAESHGVQDTLDRMPRTLIRARRTLAHADRTLADAADLTDDLAPGVRELRKIAAPLNGLLGTVVDVGPLARGTLASARRSTTDVNGLVARATALLPTLDSLSRQAVEQLQCVRPYTPEIVGFASTWGDWVSSTDGKDKYVRANVQNFLPAGHNVQTSNSGQLKDRFPGLEYGFPRPPGEVAGQPWYLPQCGAGPEATNPYLDPEGERNLSNAGANP